MYNERKIKKSRTWHGCVHWIVASLEQKYGTVYGKVDQKWNPYDRVHLILSTLDISYGTVFWKIDQT